MRVLQSHVTCSLMNGRDKSRLAPLAPVRGRRAASRRAAAADCASAAHPSFPVLPLWADVGFHKDDPLLQFREDEEVGSQEDYPEAVETDHCSRVLISGAVELAR
ncbi:hypothetical protein J6590_017454 [Homalodisca vitripennis]|nr:hypothetical protein J6590_017454 [Homalodisca vitripennis]